ncbi:MAG TPA: mannosyltransferase family protein [Pseudonocardiaceae bacterium]|nr:mannosyltransferase family protein [Pseudonocardiaceae bacterium]
MAPLETGEIRHGDLGDQRSAQCARLPSTWSLLGRLVLLCAGIRIGLEAIGLVSLALHDQPVWTNAIDMWNRWDAPHLLRLAEVGYVRSSPPPNTDDPLYIVFFPLFPLAVHIVSLVVQNLVLSGLVVSFAASVGAGYFLFRLVALDAEEAAAWRAVFLLFSFPTAYFLAAPFTEALALFAVLASVYAARTGRWAGAGVAGALATGTRVTGIALAPALLLEVLARKTSVSDRVRGLAWVSLAAAGLLTYLASNQIVHGDPLYFIEVQRTHWSNQAAPPWQPVQVAIESLLAGGNDFTFTFIYVGRVAGVLVALPLLVLAVRRLRLPDVLYGWTAFILTLSSSWLISFPRYLLVLYPLFVVGAGLTRSPRAFIPFVLSGTALQVWLMWRYSVGEWTF